MPDDSFGNNSFLDDSFGRLNESKPNTSNDFYHNYQNDEYDDYLCDYEDNKEDDYNNSMPRNFKLFESNQRDEKNLDHIDQVMLKAYEDEENLVMEIEKVQNKELQSVMAQEAKLTKQLSFEKQVYLHRQKWQKEDVNETETENEDLVNKKEVYRGKSRTFYIDEESQNDESEIDGKKSRTTKQMHEKLLLMTRNP